MKVSFLFFFFLFLPLFAEENFTEDDLPRVDPRVQQEFYAILGAIDSVFQEAKIPFWLTAGSLLGALRHGEMIPWDDDIDIALFHDSIAQVIAMRTHLEKKGLQLLVMPDYMKIFAKEGKSIAKGDGENYLWKYPFVDLFFMREKDGRVVHASERLEEGLVGDWFEWEDLKEPLPLLIFGPLAIEVPRNADRYLERLYGKECWEVAYADYDHALEKKLQKTKVKLKSIDRKEISLRIEKLRQVTLPLS